MKGVIQMNETLSTWMKLSATVVVIVGLVWGILMTEMGSIADAIATMMGGTP